MIKEFAERVLADLKRQSEWHAIQSIKLTFDRIAAQMGAEAIARAAAVEAAKPVVKEEAEPIETALDLASERTPESEPAPAAEHA